MHLHAERACLVMDDFLNVLKLGSASWELEFADSESNFLIRWDLSQKGSKVRNGEGGKRITQEGFNRIAREWARGTFLMEDIGEVHTCIEFINLVGYNFWSTTTFQKM